MGTLSCSPLCSSSTYTFSLPGKQSPKVGIWMSFSSRICTQRTGFNYDRNRTSARSSGRWLHHLVRSVSVSPASRCVPGLNCSWRISTERLLYAKKHPV